MSDVFIRASGAYEHALSDAGAPDLRADLAAVLREPPRRIDRFIELALLGVGRCLQQASAPANTAVYLASTRGDLHATLDVLKPLVRDGQLPRPNTFINTVSNAACFHLAACFGLIGRSQCIGGRSFAFESALQLAIIELRAGVVPAALVGVVEAPPAPLEEHRRRLGLNANAPLVEASRWLLLQLEAQHCRARIEVCHFTDEAAFLTWRPGACSRTAGGSQAHDDAPGAAALFAYLSSDRTGPHLSAHADELGRVSATVCER